MESSKNFFLLISLLFVQNASAPFVDVAIAFHMDDADSRATNDFKDFVKQLGDKLKPGSDYNDTRMGVIFGRSDGRTSVKVPLSNGISIYNVDLSGKDFFKEKYESDVTNLKPIFKRISSSVFNRNRTRSGDRPETPNFLVVYMRATASQNVNDSLKNAMDNGADVAIFTTGPSSFDYRGFDAPEQNRRFGQSDADLANRVSELVLRAVNSCNHMITWTTCHHVKKDKRCPCIREVEVRVSSRASEKFCPESAKGVPCRHKDCPPLNLRFEWTTLGIVFVVMMSVILSTFVICPFACLIFLYLAKKYSLTILESVINQADQIVREAAASAAGIVRGGPKPKSKMKMKSIKMASKKKLMMRLKAAANANATESEVENVEAGEGEGEIEAAENQGKTESVISEKPASTTVGEVKKTGKPVKKSKLVEKK